MANFGNHSISKEEFMKWLAEAIPAKRGIEEGKPFNPMNRINAINLMEK
jgi:hypothetical protein